MFQFCTYIVTDNEVKADEASVLASSNTDKNDAACYEEVDTSLWHDTAHYEEINTSPWQNRTHPSQENISEEIEMPMYTNVVYPAPTARNIEMTSNVAYATTGGLRH